MLFKRRFCTQISSKRLNGSSHYPNNWSTLSYSSIYSLDSSMHKLQTKRWVTMSASLHILTGLHCLTIQVLNTRVWFLDIWYTSLTFVNKNFSPLNLDYTVSFVKVWIRIDLTCHAIADTVYLPCAPNWAKLVWTGHSQLRQVLMQLVDANVILLSGVESPIVAVCY